MKNLLLSMIIIGSMATLAFGQEASNYILIVNNDSIPINLDEGTDYTLPSGEKLALKLAQSDILSFQSSLVSFQYPKEISISSSDLGDGISQSMAVNPTGNGIMIQEYTTMDPSLIVKLMLSELTKESVSYGYEKVEEEWEHTLVGGEKLKGYKAILTYKGEKEIYSVATYGEKDEGILVMTMHLDQADTEGMEIIDMILKTMNYTESK